MSESMPKNPISQLFGFCIRHHRKEKKLSELALSKKLHVSQQQYSRYERGDTAITIDLLFNILDILDMTFIEFYNSLFEVISNQSDISYYLSSVNIKDWTLNDIKNYYFSNTCIN